MNLSVDERSRTFLLAVAALLCGCTEKGGESTGSSGGSSSGEVGTTEPSTTEPGTTEPSPTEPSTGAPETDTFGFTCVTVAAGQGVEASVLAGTRKVLIDLDYEPCLLDYYQSKHPEMRLDGAEGADVFAAWKLRLCAEDVPGRAECEVVAFSQEIAEEGGGMTIEYSIPAGAELQGRKLLWGPGPLPAYAECDDGLKPVVRVGGQAAVSGLDEAGVKLWGLQSFGADGGLMGLTGAGCIAVNVQPAT